jgi:Fe-S-cluster-containing dehydrogenase component
VRHGLPGGGADQELRQRRDRLGRLDKCVDCLLCTVGCAYAGIALDAGTGRVAKCDTCEGKPACVPPARTMR